LDDDIAQFSQPDFDILSDRARKGLEEEDAKAAAEGAEKKK